MCTASKRVQVTVGDKICGRIGHGLVVLLGVATGDTLDDVHALVEKIVGLRIFDDAQGKMNLSLADVAGAMLVVSQFTLLGDCRKGRRPSFVAAAPPEIANTLYEAFVVQAADRGVPVSTGKFREHMLVSLTNDGPVTLLLDSKEQGSGS